ncbi:flavin reductase family protein [Amycolatopsis taiwanensis]|uniref:flavin reductase family protein n=1 Tax=Amycolatopsis taiwanensis TaxID=342230 RepID=UPI0004883528|nr:flavin reductase family protein [Amycolatopsis taiwanensis]
MVSSDSAISDGGEVVTPAEFRAAMADFASGVTVVTGLDAGDPVGFACQAFASVSLEPPLVVFCADHRSRSWPRIRRSGRFCVNVLGEHQTSLCERFGSSQGRKFDGAEWSLTRWGTPALPDVLMRVHADVNQVHPAGDHDLVVGRVLAVERIAEHRPMIFFRGGFGLGTAATATRRSGPPRQGVLSTRPTTSEA